MVCDADAHEGPLPVSGTITYSVDNGASSGVALNHGIATITLASPPAGHHNLTVFFAAQGNYEAASPASFSFVVTP